MAIPIEGIENKGFFYTVLNFSMGGKRVVELILRRLLWIKGDIYKSNILSQSLIYQESSNEVRKSINAKQQQNVSKLFTPPKVHSSFSYIKLVQLQ